MDTIYLFTLQEEVINKLILWPIVIYNLNALHQTLMMYNCA